MMQKHTTTTALALLAIGLLASSSLQRAVSEEFPDTVIARCKYADAECLATTFTRVLQEHASGIPEIGLAATDPLYYGNVTVSQSTGGPVSMTLRLSDSSILGWSKATVSNVVGFDKDPRKSKFEMHMKVPFDQIVGQYQMTGQFLLIALKGSGAGKMQFTDLEMRIKFHTDVETRDNEDYLKLKKVSLDITCKKMHTEFDRLFKDKAINDNIGAVLNDNSDLIFNELRKEFGRARGLIVRNLLAPVFEKFPYRMLFSDA